jgi:uncharacterized protein
MKILAITDIHGAYNVAEKILQHEKADVVVLGGDLTNVGTVKEVESTIKKFREHCNRILCIAGNMDTEHHDDWYKAEGISINGKGIVIEGVGFFGVSGGPKSPLRTSYEITEEEILARSEAGYLMVKSCHRKIFVPHAPPYGTKLDIVHSGYHVGSTAVREFIELMKPDVVICGHIHEGRGYDTIEKTQIVNCGYGHHGYYAVINIEKDIHIYNKQFAL